MHVKVFGEKIEIEVSDGGIFYDKETKTISASTMKNLQKKLVIAKAKNQKETPVSDYHGRKGKVLGRVTGVTSRWRKRYFRVQWEDGTTSEDSGGGLRRIITEDEAKELQRLQAEYNAAQQDLNVKGARLGTYRCKFDIAKELEQLYPL
jgi:hypothetical protein